MFGNIRNTRLIEPNVDVAQNDGFRVTGLGLGFEGLWVVRV